MIVLFENAFFKDIEKLKDKKIKHEIESVISSVELAENTKQIKQFKKLTGFKNAYRIKVGVYRIGIYLLESKIVFARFLHRKDAYKYFP